MTLHDKYKFFKTSVILILLILIVAAADTVLVAAQDVFSPTRLVESFLIVVCLMLLFAFGWSIWYFSKQDIFDRATAYVNQSIDALMKNEKTPEPLKPLDPSKIAAAASASESSESVLWLFVRYLGFFAGLGSTGMLVYLFIKALGFVPTSYSIVAVLIETILGTLLSVFSIYFLLTGTLFNVTMENIGKHVYPISLAFYLIFAALLLYYDPWNAIRENVGYVILTTVLFLAAILPLIYASYYQTFGFNTGSVTRVLENALKILFGVGVSFAVIFFFFTLYNFILQFFATDFGLSSNVVNLVLIVITLSLVYKFLNQQDLIRRMPPVVRLIVNSLLYIPCLVTIFIDLGIVAYTPGKDRTYLILVLIMLCILVFIFSKPSLERWYVLQDGKLIQNAPKPLDKVTVLSSYQQLNDPTQKKPKAKLDWSKAWNDLAKPTEAPSVTQPASDYYKGPLPYPLTNTPSCTGTPTAVTPTPTIPKPTTDPNHPFAYQYALSSWIFLAAKPPNTNVNYSQFVSILNYANKPKILYRAATNTLRVVVKYDAAVGKEPTEIAHPDMVLDDQQNRILLETSEFPLQKWNHVVINNLGGTLDIFINGELVGTASDVLPYMTYDNLESGTQNGVDGKICNVVYYKHPLNKDQIQLLYQYSKGKNPPMFPSILSAIF